MSNYPIPLPTTKTRALFSNCAKSSVAVTTTAAKILQANNDRKGFHIFNNSGRILYVDFLQDVATSSYLYTMPNNSILLVELPWVGDIWGIANGNGNIQIREFT
jgi:hypothetical protein